MRYEILSENFGPVGTQLDVDQLDGLNVEALVLGGFLREIADNPVTPAPQPESPPEAS